ncbi:hypothetical protein JAAARDRAFT_140675 [Jaapia argillacea MUCL 33604]|uniref:Protein-S-isoprenylcysteine O-methyltransferase n=1 Tax=Jaapia argillacea MUCL 33604 TaxID=933084 RepID=A0A067PJN3_9AGAM|nr:hypothetical protein JAAARDRAFT_140675 [Jaapia argillacea MUCL 33604]
MPSAPLLKVLLLLGTAWTYHVTFTPPNIASPSELTTPSGWEGFLCWSIPFLVLSRGIPWIVALGETAVILAQHNSSSPMASRVLKILVHRETSISLTAPFVSGFLIAMSGGLLRCWCYRTLGRFFTFQLSIRRDHRLVTHGPYSFVRHPSYTGGLLCTSGVWICMFSRGSWLRESGVAEYQVVQIVIVLYTAVLSLLYVAVIPRMCAEDVMMRKEFGKVWDDWALRVPYRVLPGIY